MEIRPARPGDVDELYRICLLTADAGQDATHRHADPRVPGHLFLGAYLELLPAFALVLDDGSAPLGYVVGAPDTREFEAICERDWWPRLRAEYPDPGPEPKTVDEGYLGAIHRPWLARDEVVAGYPAHLHIDLLPAAQGRGFGRALIERQLAAYAAAGASGVHLDVVAENTSALAFYRRVGFTEFPADNPEGWTMVRSLGPA